MALPARREPHWQRLGKGAYLGFRRGPDTWIARYRARDGRQHYHPLGDLEEFDAAKRAAEAWLGQLSRVPGRTARRGTVGMALEAYIADLKRHRRTDAAKENEVRFSRIIAKDVIGELALEDATRDDFLEWRERISAGLLPRTVNRNVAAVVAGLNRAHRALGFVGNADAWRLDRLADDVEDEGDTAIFLSPAQRAAIIEKAVPRAADFLRALQFTGARPKELAAAKVEDFDGQTVRLAHRKGRPAKLRTRRTVLSDAGVRFFANLAAGKAEGALLLTVDGEQAWKRHHWARAINAAIAAHNKAAKARDRVPGGATAYSFRHARISELLQVHGVDPLTVAQQCGTSLAMIEKAYLKFIPAAFRAKLAAIRDA